MKPIAIAFSDLHLNDWKQFNQDDKRLKTQLEVLTEIEDKSEELKVPILFCGDLFHTDKQLSNNIINKTFPTLYDRFTGKGQNFYAISGNHDLDKFNSRLNPANSYLNVFDLICPKFCCLDWEFTMLGEYNLFGIPFLDDNNEMEVELKRLKAITPKGNKKRILMIHTILPGAKDNDGRDYTPLVEGVTDMGKFFEGFDLVLCGHIHKPMPLSKKVIQLGAPLQYRISDINAKLGYWIIYEDLSIEFARLEGYPEYKFYVSEDEKEEDGNYWVKIDELEEKSMEEGTYETFDSYDKKKSIIQKYCELHSINKVKESIMLKYLG